MAEYSAVNFNFKRRKIFIFIQNFNIKYSYISRYKFITFRQFHFIL